MNGSHILTIDRFSVDSEAGGPRCHLTRGGFTVVRVLVVLVVLANVNDRQLPERRHVHSLVKQALPQRAVAKETDGHLIRAAHLDRHRSAGSDSGAAADDGIG